MAEKQSNKDRLKEITDGIEQGIRELFDSDQYRRYLSTMSRFHRYSLNNVMLIHMQRPDATLVAGFNKWRDQFGRNVKKGEKGIKIIAPTPFKKKVEKVKLDPDTQAPMLDRDGNAIMEEKEIQIPLFKVVSVFDVSQTEGKPLPELVSNLNGSVQQYEIFMEALRRSSPVPMEIKPIGRDSDGFFSLTDQSITIRAGMSEVQTVCAAIHEIAHSKLHNYDTRGIQPSIYSIRESNGIQAMTIEYFHRNDPKLKADIERIVTEMRDAKEYGSILNITPVDFAGLYARFDEIRNDINMMQMPALDELLPLVKCAELLAQKYDVVVTNPPYMGSSGMSDKLQAYVKSQYADVKSDLYSVFIKKNLKWSKLYVSMITMESWMFLSSFEELRTSILSGHTIQSLTHMPYLGKGGTSLGINFGTVVFVISEAKISKADAAAILRETVDTVGQKGKRGKQIRNVISVGMLSEGWDAKTVTHILGLRAFSSQLLCEQVVGRGLRRTSYDLAEGSDMFTPEYVNIFGIPFTFLPHESDEQGTPPTTPPKTQVEALKERSEYEIRWPNIIRLDRVFKPQLTVDLDRIDTLELNAADTRLRADLAPIIDGKTDLTKCTEIDLQKLDAELRMQRIVFEASGQVYDLMKTSWQNEATKFALLGQVIRLVEEYLKSGAIVINPPLFNTDPVRQRIIYMMNMNKIVQHLWSFIKLEQTEKIAPIFDPNKKIRSTADMPTWFTSKPCYITKTSQISHCVFDSAWEATESYVIEKNPHVTAWAKNDHLGFEILYVFDGVVRKYLPDFLIRLDNGKTLILETKGQETRRDKEKRKALSEWVAAVNSLGEYGEWCNDVSYNIADVDGIIAKYM